MNKGKDHYVNLNIIVIYKGMKMNNDEGERITLHRSGEQPNREVKPVLEI